MLQTILFPKKKFTMTEAIVWLQEHKYHAGKVDTGNNYLRFRQRNPTGLHYYTITLPNGIELVYEKSNF